MRFCKESNFDWEKRKIFLIIKVRWLLLLYMNIIYVNKCMIKIFFIILFYIILNCNYILEK